ncbi:F0F1 ATP synthase subunit epsilon [Rhodococcus sp. SRB_17]|uniref:F0F1 ATP synthase subunit epsilon n=1 Tax=unclassified Rhodococcus (in: high G+C Gram-positive bacteria) TaxID=192944 RepID=UPI000B943B55|nr:MULTISPECIES: F0F1 ATP synthase subunit epsilon [unclassified Rhodococcus (in: high G+C Gram-positive bacteria)]MCJ0906692.1 F0F1 ATP synthase subunit epsilon [Rhodococcus sp. ARC_M6]MDI9918134.1 F0F1 ATP synthase subunit epsilon [Rhodococcus sp. IEGM 1379]NMM86050.1 F0F1 ATP synthase subunit epsilon [Rhodococcus sp. SRB_17]OYD71265.1 ATP synthase F1 subcomplex epsilon subunit [Rhodococcus sp. OK302]
MAEMTVELVAVEQRLWSGSATLVSAQTTEGEIGIMPGHEPVLGQLIEGGTVSITSVNGERVVAAVHGGFLSVTATTVTILAESADMAQDIDVNAAKAVLADTRADDEAIAVAKGQLRAVERA